MSRESPASGTWGNAINGWLLLLPAFVLLAIFTHWPVIGTVWDSFHATPKGSNPAPWVGLENYQVMVADEVFWKSLRNNLWYALGTVPISIALAIVMALWVNSKMAGRTWLRMAFFTPTILPMIAVANIWLFFFTPQYGLLEQVLRPFGIASRNWLGNPETALACVTLVAIWKEAGFFMIFYLAALQSIPPSLEEAARVEGASRSYYFWRVVFPLLMPTTLFVMINAVINSVRLVDHIFVMTRGGPNNATSLLLFHIYQVGFNFWDTGYAAALTLVVLFFLALVAIGQFVFLDKKVHYQ